MNLSSPFRHLKSISPLSVCLDRDQVPGAFERLLWGKDAILVLQSLCRSERVMFQSPYDGYRSFHTVDLHVQQQDWTVHQSGEGPQDRLNR